MEGKNKGWEVRESRAEDVTFRVRPEGESESRRMSRTSQPQAQHCGIPELGKSPPSSRSGCPGKKEAVGLACE